MTLRSLVDGEAIPQNSPYLRRVWMKGTLIEFVIVNFHISLLLPPAFTTEPFQST